jgi:hypothetical protein
MLQVFLVLHVLGAIFVFGPSLAFTFLASEVRRMPQSGHFAAVVGDAIERKVILPGAVVQGITGVCLIVVGGFDLTRQANRWLLGAIILYAIAIVFAFAVQARNVERLVELTKAPPAAPAPGATAPAGPPPEIAAMGQRLARGGMFLTVMIVLIVILMVTKPGI